MGSESSGPANEKRFTVVVPCYNEEGAIAETIDEITNSIGEAPYELLVVNDGSGDRSGEILEQIVREGRFPHLRVVHHEKNRGYGAALKTGIRRARTELVAITDADGTYPNDRLPELVEIAADADMVVGHRSASEGMTYSPIRRIPKLFLANWVSWLARRRVPDMNSGLRVFRKSLTERFFRVLPDGFSFTTTQTLCMLCNRFDVRYIPISYNARVGKSKIKPIRDTLRFMQLILRTGMYFGPLRALAPVVALLGLMFLASLAYDIFAIQNLTDKTVMLMLFTMNTGIFALLADMIDKRSGE